MRFKRRDFLKASGCFVATAALGGVGGSGCGGDDGGGGPDAGPGLGAYAFPQGVASGDPRPDSVVLWTRAVSPEVPGPVTVTAEVSTTQDFANLVVSETMAVDASSDFTLRLLVDGLSPGTHYYYRFRAGLDASPMGRTLTAPNPDANVPVNLAWVSCQDFAAGTYGAYRQMINDDLAKPEAEQIQFVVHLGDFIYETVSAGFQTAVDENFEAIAISTPSGDRVVPDLPNGATAGGSTFADTVDDYRHLYRIFLSDPNLQAARARWPFINVWDDHEFTNDAWQSMANYTDPETLDEPAQTRKVASNQAWFEYIPANLTDAVGVPGVPNEASDFAPVTVTNEPMGDVVDANNLATESNNVAAIGSMTIYRSFRYGKNVELVMTDERSYRSDHAIPEELTGSILFFDPRNALPWDMVKIMDEGMTANGGSPPSTILGAPNLRASSPVGTMLGKDQKDWFKQTMMASDATWKIWGNEVPMLHVRITPTQAEPLLTVDRIMNGDAWDGYPTERDELMQFLRTNDIRNVVVITGDVHAHFAGVVMDDHAAATPNPVVAEFTAAGIASNSLFSFFEAATRGGFDDLRKLITYDNTEKGGTVPFVENMNLLLMWGVDAAAAAVASTDAANDITDAQAAADPLVNPWISYVDSNAQGYGLMTVTETEISVDLVTINRPITASSHSEGAGIKRTASFTLAAQGSGETPTIVGPTVTGEKPFPLT